ncbi:ABC transporter ATP-binding protein [Thioclava sp. BHET1]|nr:ABC transporter ATP-binding protein [Thioclava sp. BHET1]
MAETATIKEYRPEPAAAPKELAVQMQGIRKSYDGRVILNDLGLEVAQGEFLAILGPSGSGKTTVMRLIGGFETAEAGAVRIGGVDVTRMSPEMRPVNTVFQSYALFPHMTVRENVAFGPRMRRASRAQRRAKADEMLDLVHLTQAADKHPTALSGGMQQRVALARALACDPAVLLLDEPLGALDRKLRDTMQRELRRVQTELGATFVYVTHDQEEAFGMADRLAVMRDGRFAQIAAPATVYDEPASLWIARFVGTVNTLEAKVVAREGAGAMLDSALGRIEAGWADPTLRPGDSATVAVRPEATMLRPSAPFDPASNTWIARLSDRVVIGANTRLRATAADGTAFEALLQRTVQGEMAAQMGDSLIVSFSKAAARAYRPEPA